jgi:hypothetical protein
MVKIVNETTKSVIFPIRVYKTIWVCFKWVGRGEASGEKHPFYPGISSRLPRPY